MVETLRLLNKKVGFTLFEVLVALLIVSLSLVTILSAFGMSNRYILRAEEEREVTRFAEQLLLEIEMNSYGKSMNLSDLTLHEGFTYSFEVKDVILDDIKSENYQGLKEVTLYVFSSNTNREYKFTTWIFLRDELGLNLRRDKKMRNTR